MFPKYAKRRQAWHLCREFIRGAGTGAQARTKKVFSTYGKILLAGVAIAVIWPALAAPVLIGGVAIGVGTAAYAVCNGVAAGLHRWANKGIPEAPNHDRRMQRWGRRTAIVASAAAHIAATGITAGALSVAATSSASPRPHFIERSKPRLDLVRAPVAAAQVAEASRSLAAPAATLS